MRPTSPTMFSNNDCCSPSNYDHNKRSSLANSQIGKFNVVKQSRVSQQQEQQYNNTN